MERSWLRLDTPARFRFLLDMCETYHSSVVRAVDHLPGRLKRRGERPSKVLKGGPSILICLKPRVRDIAGLRGMTEIAVAAGLGRANL